MKIGVFDSGFGGLTVLRALLEKAPAADYVYLGDTARLPYGAKSRETVARYAVSSAKFLVEQGAQFLVIACNTASALALDAIRAAVAVPVSGVIETGVGCAAGVSETREVMVVATAATVESHAYATACQEQGLRAIEKACPLLVSLVEEGWIEHPVTAQVLRIYMTELQEQAQKAGLDPDTLVLGCTHYPLLRGEIEKMVPRRVRVIDSAEATAERVAETLQLDGGTGSGRAQFFATDSVKKFRALGGRFLGREMDEVELVDLEKQPVTSRQLPVASSWKP
jgi:glutamate racemase